jgi:hypothetical protein
MVKKSTVKLPKSYDKTALGDEPVWNSDVEVTQNEIIRALNWYNYFYDNKKAVVLLKNNYIRDLSELELLDLLSDSEIPPTLCYFSRMASLGCNFPTKSREKFDTGIEKLLQRAQGRAKKEEGVEKRKVVSIQDRVLIKTREFMGEFEGQIDEFLANKFKSKFSAYEYLTKNEVKPMIAKKMIGVYDDLIAELQEVLLKKDKQLVEGYKHLKPLHIRKLIAFLETIHADILTYTNNGKKIRRTRKKRVVTSTKQIEKLQFMRNFAELQLASINPSDIIGAGQLWTYNVKYKKLTKFVSADKSGFSVKGTTLQNYSETESMVKRLRKPKEVLTKVQNGGKIVLRKLMNELTTKGEIPKGRINKDTILIRIVK